MHSSSGRSTMDILSSPSLHRFNEGVGVASPMVWCRSSDELSSNPLDWVSFSRWLAEVVLFQITVAVRVLRLREIQRIGLESTSKKGYPLSFRIWNLMQNSLLSHLDESWNRSKIKTNNLQWIPEIYVHPQLNLTKLQFKHQVEKISSICWESMLNKNLSLFIIMKRFCSAVLQNSW